MTSTRKKFEEVAEHIELSIFAGRLALGDRIPSERELMSQFGVGRSTVREALFTLQRKGLLTARSGAAPRVSRPDAHNMIHDLSGAARHLLSQPDGIRQLQSARMLFEIGLARNAAQAAGREDIEALREALEANGAADTQTAFERTDLAFHYKIAMISRNPIFTSIHHAVMGWLAEQRSVSARAGATRSEIHDQHRAIFDAIASRDAFAAEEAMEAHLMTVARYYWGAMSVGVNPAGGEGG